MGIRCFISISLPVSIRTEIEKTIAELRIGRADIKWVSAENMHITLKFLGCVPEEALTDIKDKLTTASESGYAFNFRLSGFGMFPDSRNPRVIWIGITDNGEIKKLQKKVEDSMATIGFEKENRPYSPHLTVGRVRSLKGMNSMIKAIEALKGMEFGNIDVSKMSLMKSELKSTGAQHTVLAEFNFQRRNNEHKGQ